MTEKKRSLYERQVIAMERQADALEKLASCVDVSLSDITKGHVLYHFIHAK